MRADCVDSLEAPVFRVPAVVPFFPFLPLVAVAVVVRILSSAVGRSSNEGVGARDRVDNRDAFEVRSRFDFVFFSCLYASIRVKKVQSGERLKCSSLLKLEFIMQSRPKILTVAYLKVPIHQGLIDNTCKLPYHRILQSVCISTQLVPSASSCISSPSFPHAATNSRTSPCAPRPSSHSLDPPDSIPHLVSQSTRQWPIHKPAHASNVLRADRRLPPIHLRHCSKESRRHYQGWLGLDRKRILLGRAGRVSIQS